MLLQLVNVWYIGLYWKQGDYLFGFGMGDKVCCFVYCLWVVVDDFGVVGGVEDCVDIFFVDCVVVQCGVIDIQCFGGYWCCGGQFGQCCYCVVQCVGWGIWGQQWGKQWQQFVQFYFVYYY